MCGLVKNKNEKKLSLFNGNYFWNRVNDNTIICSYKLRILSGFRYCHYHLLVPAMSKWHNYIFATEHTPGESIDLCNLMFLLLILLPVTAKLISQLLPKGFPAPFVIHLLFTSTVRLWTDSYEMLNNFAQKIMYIAKSGYQASPNLNFVINYPCPYYFPLFTQDCLFSLLFPQVICRN